MTSRVERVLVRGESLRGPAFGGHQSRESAREPARRPPTSPPPSVWSTRRRVWCTPGPKSGRHPLKSVDQAPRRVQQPARTTPPADAARTSGVKRVDPDPTAEAIGPGSRSAGITGGRGQPTCPQEPLEPSEPSEPSEPPPPLSPPSEPPSSEPRDPPGTVPVSSAGATSAPTTRGCTTSRSW